MADKKDTRYVYGVGCTWNGPIQAVGIAPGLAYLPCCPKCGGLLMESPTAKEWWSLARKYEAEGHPGYFAMMNWAQGKCFNGMNELKQAYTEATGLPTWPSK